MPFVLYPVHYPLSQPPRLFVEVHTDFYDIAWVGGEWSDIVFLLDLFQGFFSSAVQLDFYYVDVFLSLYEQVYATVARAAFLAPLGIFI